MIKTKKFEIVLYKGGEDISAYFPFETIEIENTPEGIEQALRAAKEKLAKQGLFKYSEAPMGTNGENIYSHLEIFDPEEQGQMKIEHEKQIETYRQARFNSL